MSGPELLACPFCGGAHQFKSTRDFVWIRCVKCKADGPMFATEAEAIAAWNHRAPSQGWQPIETAPKDGSRIMLAHSADRITENYHKQVGEGLWHYTEDWRWANDSCSCCYGAMMEGNPTHWQPLPTPPENCDG